MFFNTILRIAAILGAIQTFLVWMDRLLRWISRAISVMQNRGVPRLKKAYARRFTT